MSLHLQIQVEQRNHLHQTLLGPSCVPLAGARVRHRQSQEAQMSHQTREERNEPAQAEAALATTAQVAAQGHLYQ